MQKLFEQVKNENYLTLQSVISQDVINYIYTIFNVEDYFITDRLKKILNNPQTTDKIFHFSNEHAFILSMILLKYINLK